MKRPATLLLGLVGGLIANPASAFVLDGQITSGAPGGTFVKLDASEAIVVGMDTFESPDLFAFDEDQNIALPHDIVVDIGLGEPVIRAGTVVASHYVFFDPRDFGERQTGYVDFDSPILGVATRTETMAATDFLANTDVTYLSPALRGLETRDHVWIDPNNPYRLRVAWIASSPGDYVRVFTAKSPGV